MIWSGVKHFIDCGKITFISRRNTTLANDVLPILISIFGNLLGWTHFSRISPRLIIDNKLISIVRWCILISVFVIDSRNNLRFSFDQFQITQWRKRCLKICVDILLLWAKVSNGTNITVTANHNLTILRLWVLLQVR